MTVLSIGSIDTNIVYRHKDIYIYIYIYIYRFGSLSVIVVEAVVVTGFVTSLQMMVVAKLMASVMVESFGFGCWFELENGWWSVGG